MASSPEWDQQQPPTLRWCSVCGQGLPRGGLCPNRWCSRADRQFSVVFSAGVYSGSLRSCIVAYKYRHERWRAAPLARLLASYLSQHATWFEEFDLIVPMPAYLGPGARRRWDPTGLLVQRLSEMLEAGWDVDLRAVSKQAETPALTGRSFTERLALAEGPLRRVLAVADPVRVRRATVLVVDDVFTEGCTLREVARVLLRAGAAEVAGLVLARPPWLG